MNALAVMFATPKRGRSRLTSLGVRRMKDGMAATVEGQTLKKLSRAACSPGTFFPGFLSHEIGRTGFLAVEMDRRMIEPLD